MVIALAYTIFKESMNMKRLMILCVLTQCLTLSCDTALDPTTEGCNFGTDEQYCADEHTIMECMGCRDQNSSYHCWKETGCYEPFTCRYRFKNNDEEETFAQCLEPTDERYERSFAEDPLP